MSTRSAFVDIGSLASVAPALQCLLARSSSWPTAEFLLESYASLAHAVEMKGEADIHFVINCL